MFRPCSFSFPILLLAAAVAACGGADGTCLDGDGDGYGQGTSCAGPDCNDAVAEIHPGAVDVPYDGFDQDCDGRDLWDVDGDGQTKEGAPYGDARDCNDDDAHVRVGAAFNEPQFTDFCRRDFDGDGYSDTSIACQMTPTGSTCAGTGGDCDDNDPSVYPGTNANDPACGPDLDGDGYTAGALDCDDQNPAVPIAEVRANDVDDDCNPVTNDDPVFQWAADFRGPQSETLASIAAVSDGVVVVGFQGGGAVLGPESSPMPLPAMPGGLIAKYDGTGVLRWAKTWSIGVGSVASFADDSMLVSSAFAAQVTLGMGEPNAMTLTPVGRVDLLLVRLASDGSLLWAKQAGGVGAGGYYGAMTTVADGSSIVAGRIDGSVTFGAGEANATTLSVRPFLARYNADGTLAWATTPALQAEPNALAVRQDGTVLLLASGTPRTAECGYTLDLISYDPSGIEQTRNEVACVSGAGNVDGFGARSVAELSDGSLAIAVRLYVRFDQGPEVTFQRGPNEVRTPPGPDTFFLHYSGGTLDWVRAFSNSFSLLGFAPAQSHVLALLSCVSSPCTASDFQQPGRGPSVLELDTNNQVVDFDWAGGDAGASKATAGHGGSFYFAGSFEVASGFGWDGPGSVTFQNSGGTDAYVLQLRR